MDDNKIAMQESQDFKSEKFLMERVDLVGLAESFLFYSTIKKENNEGTQISTSTSEDSEDA